MNGENPAVVPAEQETAKKKKKKEKVKRPLWVEILSWVMTIIGAVCAALLIRSVVGEPVRVDGESMLNTLGDGEIMLVSKYDYSSIWLCMPWQSDNAAGQMPRITYGTPKFLDVVLCRYPARGAANFVKRITGMPGDTVELRDGYLYVNDAQVEEEKDLIDPAYRVSGGSDGKTFGPYYVPKRGDTLTISGSTTELHYLINGEEWARKSTTLLAKDEDGKRLKIWSKNPEEVTGGRPYRTTPVISYDGKEWSGSDIGELVPTLTEKTFTIDDDYYFLMGDHRNNSNDSRSVGAVERSMIAGHVRRVVFPFSKWRGIQ